MKKLMKTFKYISILILAITFTGCEDEDAVLPQVVAGFTYTIDSDTRTVTFINTSDNAQKYEWDLGDGTTSDLINPIKTYAIGSYTIVMQAINIAGEVVTFTDTITFLDEEVPLISLIGDATMNVTLGDSFTDPGATALDEVDGDLTASIVVGGDTVDVNVEGTYIITYNVSDTQGNAAEEVERTVNVSAITCDEETVENIDPANGDLNWTFKTNDEAHIFEAFGNTASSIVTNPVIDGINTSCNVEKLVKTSGCETWSGLGTELATALDFTVSTTNKMFTMKVLAENQVTDVTLRLERLPHPDTDPAIEKVASISQVGVWQELTFDFTDISSGTYKSMIIYFDRNASCDGDIYYFDDIVQVPGTGGSGGTSTCTDTMLALPIDFDCDGIDYVSKDTGDVAFEVVDNPELSGINASVSKVGKMVFDSNQPWENMNLNLDTPISFATNKSIKLKLFSNSARVIKLKVETGGTPVENDQNHTGSGWEELTFTLNTDQSFSNFVLFVDGGSNTVGTFYIDDIEHVSSGGGTGGGGSTGQYSLDQPIDFETAGFGAQWSWNVFENADNPPLEFVANPVSGGINTSATVAKITARQTGAPWVGTETAHGEMNLNWDLSASNAIIKIMVYKTVISDVGIKLVNPAGGAQGEIKVANTKINEWEELTFDFSSRIGNGLDGSTNIDQIVVFPDFSDPRTAETVTYFDNITFN